MITAIIRREQLEAVEVRLQRAGVTGVTVSTVKGYGEYANFFTHDWMVTHARVEVLAPDAECERIVDAIRDAAGTGEAGDGLIAVVPVRRLIKIRTGDEIRISASSPGEQAPDMPAQSFVNGPRPAISFLAWAIVVLGVGGGAAVVLTASRHEMHLLAACLGAVLVLCGIFGAVAYTNRQGAAAPRGRSGGNAPGEGT